MLGKNVKGAVIGVIGAGKIGRAVMERAKGFGMTLLYNSRSRKGDIEKNLGAKFMEIDDLLKSSDYVSLNCPLNESTYHLIGEKELRLMRDDAILINTARGPVVDENALVEALKSRWIGGAGLDVFEEEPKVHPGLFKLDNVTMVPHVGSATTTTRHRMASLVVGGIISILNNEIPDNLVNPEVFGKSSGDDRSE
jgi:glyoxylate reductase